MDQSFVEVCTSYGASQRRDGQTRSILLIKPPSFHTKTAGSTLVAASYRKGGGGAVKPFRGVPSGVALAF